MQMGMVNLQVEEQTKYGYEQLSLSVENGEPARET